MHDKTAMSSNTLQKRIKLLNAITSIVMIVEMHSIHHSAFSLDCTLQPPVITTSHETDKYRKNRHPWHFLQRLEMRFMHLCAHRHVGIVSFPSFACDWAPQAVALAPEPLIENVYNRVGKLLHVSPV